jgi:hypothetical protein
MHNVVPAKDVRIRRLVKDIMYLGTALYIRSCAFADLSYGM